jgi:hypothetical protein
MKLNVTEKIMPFQAILGLPSSFPRDQDQDVEFSQRGVGDGSGKVKGEKVSAIDIVYDRFHVYTVYQL